MHRKKLSLLLAVLLLITSLNLSLPVKAKTSTVTAQKVITEIGIMDTDQGSTKLASSIVTRSEFAQMLVNLSSMKDTVTAASNISLFRDVSKKHWAAGYIKTAIEQGWMSGYLSGSFQPDGGITLQDAVYGVIQLLGYSNTDLGGNIYTGAMKLYTSKSLNQNIKRSNKDVLTRSDCINLFYNVLITTTKDNKVYGQSLGYTLDSTGNIDYLSLLNANLTGPIIVDANWIHELPFLISDAKLFLNSSPCVWTDIDTNDVLYYSERQKTVFAYNNKITGTITAISPNHLNPTTVTVGGKDYTLGTPDMTLEFSTLGSVKENDVVTLILGKDNTVVSVLGLDELNITITGIVINTGQHIVTNAEGDLQNTYYAVIVDAGGTTYEQDFDMKSISLSEGSLAQITYTDGIPSVKAYETNSDSFSNETFSSDASTLGKYKLAANVNILDYYQGEYIGISPSRLRNVTLWGGAVIYYETNGRGEITSLLLNHVTGDLYDYGIYQGIQAINNGTVTNKYIIAGKSYTGTSEFFSADNGPLGFFLEDSQIMNTMKLTGTSVTSMGAAYVQDTIRKYQITDDVDVYYLSNGEYLYTTLDKVSNLKKYKLTAYYDRSVTIGGRVRIIIAESINQ